MEWVVFGFFLVKWKKMVRREGRILTLPDLLVDWEKNLERRFRLP